MLGTYPLSILPLSTLQVEEPPVVSFIGGGDDTAYVRYLNTRTPDPVQVSRLQERQKKIMLKREDEEIEVIMSVIMRWL